MKLVAFFLWPKMTKSRDFQVMDQTILGDFGWEFSFVLFLGGVTGYYIEFIVMGVVNNLYISYLQGHPEKKVTGQWPSGVTSSMPFITSGTQR